MFGLLRDRLKAPIRRENIQPPFYIPHYRKGRRGLVAERGDLRTLGKVSLFVFFAASIFAMQFEAIPEDALASYFTVRVYAFVCSIVMGVFWIILALAFARSRSRHSQSETFATYFWKVPVAIGYCGYLMLDKVAHERLAGVQSRFLRR